MESKSQNAHFSVKQCVFASSEKPQKFLQLFVFAYKTRASLE
ncbi:hypothetical protein CAEBREN_08291 [Caenorhabditis brenneri]|uniref:Uncharacterized protein n=1 Tax=Caenorhabditis brenneri TaxID=135651 RepID=G0ME56_CAEBE|nr:hypothetical protein CAEBREN_08291 [Caenorhabditis brenneri]